MDNWLTLKVLADVDYASFISKYKSLYYLAFPITTSAKVNKSNCPKQP